MEVAPGLTVGRGLKQQKLRRCLVKATVAPGLTVGRGLKHLRNTPPKLRWPRSARPDGRARIETTPYEIIQNLNLGSARPDGRARIETAGAFACIALGHGSARPDGRARIETFFQNHLILPIQGVAPGLTVGRGLKHSERRDNKDKLS